MGKEFLQNIFAQNQLTCSFALNKVSGENAGFKLNKEAASVGFIYRHIGETMNLFTTFLGYSTEVQNTTMGQTDRGQGKDIEEGRRLIDKGFKEWQHIIDITPDEEWLGQIDTPFFGRVTRLRLFSHVLFHNSHHCGQISMILSKGSQIS